jgi:uncharacterized protein YbjT (DUF2867 family)
LHIGYIGGNALSLLVKEHPEYQIVALVRNDDQANKLKAAFPNIDTAIGDLDSEDVLIREASKANVVISPTLPRVHLYSYSVGSQNFICRYRVV